MVNRRIIGQCSIIDFRGIAELHLTEGGMLPRELTKKEKLAVRVIYHFQQCGVPFDVLLKVKEVLIWEMEDKGLAFEYKLLDPKDIETYKIIRDMKPKEK